MKKATLGAKPAKGKGKNVTTIGALAHTGPGVYKQPISGGPICKKKSK